MNRDVPNMYAHRITACVTLLLAACGDEDGSGTASLNVLLEAEDVIIEGLEAGDGAENIRDGWAVVFDKYLAATGPIEVRLSTDETVRATAEDVVVVDLTQLPAGGLALWTLEDLAEGRWEFWYATPGAASAMRDASAARADFDEMVANDWTYWVEGMLMKTDGQSCPPAALATPGSATANGNTSGTNDCYDASVVEFRFGATADTAFGPCEIDGTPGFAVTSGGAQTVAATIHGDHLFFNGFPEGNEGGITRLAQWMADSDLDLDGTVTQTELAAIAPAQLVELDDRYQLGGSPITPLTTMYDYVIAQLKTQGHFQGEGECPVDGISDDE